MQLQYAVGVKILRVTYLRHSPSGYSFVSIKKQLLRELQLIKNPTAEREQRS
jgi:hypothetical protein